MKKKKNFLRSDVIKGVTAVKEEILLGVAVVTKGVTHDRRGEFNEESLDTVVSFGNESTFGVKSRFGHPNMSSTALGTFLGRFKNFRNG